MKPSDRPDRKLRRTERELICEQWFNYEAILLSRATCTGLQQSWVRFLRPVSPGEKQGLDLLGRITVHLWKDQPQLLGGCWVLTGWHVRLLTCSYAGREWGVLPGHQGGPPRWLTPRGLGVRESHSGARAFNAGEGKGVERMAKPALVRLFLLDKEFLLLDAGKEAAGCWPQGPRHQGEPLDRLRQFLKLLN